ncbi:hypothetical protein [Photobacterium lipolyticum]|uniref:Uncharacterized protein n=1 Tax=Photobacterium lipolyticum TaxID=266810 RepID=A0A2T3N010_9GAMM|nr:hypothetical protein [Photobacterium lipolyticum]PSW05475.1 hypothetical protein C9I89_09520 [Photobacterium lipolyticum]
MEFTDNEYAKMRLELAADAAKAVLRHIVMYERRCKGMSETAIRLLGEYCDVRGCTVKRWTEFGIPEKHVQNVLDFMAVYPCVWSRHQLAPTEREAEIWLKRLYGECVVKGRAFDYAA